MNTMSSSLRTGLFVVLVAAVLACGCGDGSGKVLPVQGTVTLEKEPLAKGTITFHPDKSKGNNATVTPVGTIENGKYSLATRSKEGAPPGWYKVTITSTVPSNPKDEYSVPKSVISEKYNDPSKSGLTAEVKEGKSTYDFTVTR
jgi:hypothetical protein